VGCCDGRIALAAGLVDAEFSLDRHQREPGKVADYNLGTAADRMPASADYSPASSRQTAAAAWAKP